MDVSLGHLHWLIDKEDRSVVCAALAECRGHQHLLTLGRKLFFPIPSTWQEHEPHLCRAPFHRSPLTPLVSPVAAELTRTAYLNTHTSRIKALNHFLHDADSGCNWLWMEPWQQYNHAQKNKVTNWFRKGTLFPHLKLPRELQEKEYHLVLENLTQAQPLTPPLKVYLVALSYFLFSS